MTTFNVWPVPNSHESVTSQSHTHRSKAIAERIPDTGLYRYQIPTRMFKANNNEYDAKYMTVVKLLRETDLQRQRKEQQGSQPSLLTSNSRDGESSRGRGISGTRNESIEEHDGNVNNTEEKEDRIHCSIKKIKKYILRKAARSTKIKHRNERTNTKIFTRRVVNSMVYNKI